MFMISMIQTRMKISTWLMVFLSVVSLGAYNLMWAYKLQSHVSEQSNERVLSGAFLYTTAALYGISTWMTGLGDADEFSRIMMVLGMVVSLMYCIAMIIFAFSARRAILNLGKAGGEGEVKVNPILTFLFGVFYINYVLNKYGKAWEEIRDFS
ncbi:DUF4234 domain-containing protein [Aeromonas phage LAh10]|uniref:DUF4234 domain-containing protein n=1 Tax=Aeromonas phage LAh10 TaxID=2591025 RepID=A0A514A1N2_9CAUD|nr:DUF4234 domain-containing protein [Aeromonas phage LAh10]QDH47181.1 DUF4234 domain-containing protein [Aeromonas phage LAh10]